MNRGRNVVHITDVMAAIMPEIVLFPLINWKLLPIAKYLKTKTT
jgi:hypothetical protein